jgi:FdhE protein
LAEREKDLKADEIRSAAAAARKQRPAYENLLDFYEKVFLAQEASRESVALKPVDLDPSLAALKQKEGFPLVTPEAFEVDIEAALLLFKQLCSQIPETNSLLYTTGIKLMEALDRGTQEMAGLVAAILKGDDGRIEKLADTIQADKAALIFLVFHSILPSLGLGAEQLAGHLGDDLLWEKGYCPLCGTVPSLSILKKEGKRFLVCGFCQHEWETIRLFCPFCENRDQKKLHYFISEEEKHYRVDVCEACNRYIKTVDARQLTRPLYPLLEHISTLHLDMLAQEKGLESGLPLWLRT